MTERIGSREAAVDKGRRYLTEGRLTVSYVEDDGVIATCRGTGSTYLVTIDDTGDWTCTCSARRTCAHLHALALVVDRAEGPTP